MPEKPLHVRVAEALGWTLPVLAGYIQDYGTGKVNDLRTWRAVSPWSDYRLLYQDIPRYDTDWSATGPLIEKYGIEIHRCAEGVDCSVPDHYGKNWEASKNIDCLPYDADALTPLIAVCNLILKLAEAGKL